MSQRLQSGPWAAPPRQGAPYPYLPQGTGLEPSASPPAGLGDEAAWRRLWDRIPGSYTCKSLALYNLHRSNIRDPDAVVSRWAVSSVVFTAGPGVTQYVFTFDTLTIYDGLRAFVEAGAGSAFDFRTVLRAGSDGAYVYGSDQNPSSFTALACGPGDVGPLPVSPMAGRPNNDWQGQVIGAAGVAPTRLAINFYGVSLWTPNGQIQ